MLQQLRNLCADSHSDGKSFGAKQWPPDLQLLSVVNTKVLLAVHVFVVSLALNYNNRT